MEQQESAARQRAEEQHKLAGLFKDAAPAPAVAACNGAAADGGAANGSTEANSAATPAGGGGFSFGFAL